MEQTNSPKEKPLVCSVMTELQVAQVGKICQDYGIQAIIKMGSIVDISQLKKAVKAKLKDRLYDLCPCESGKKFKFCCYQKAAEIKL
jgi:uncharacterized protein YecA (UPF0149 family)